MCWIQTTLNNVLVFTSFVKKNEFLRDAFNIYWLIIFEVATVHTSIDWCLRQVASINAKYYATAIIRWYTLILSWQFLEKYDSTMFSVNTAGTLLTHTLSSFPYFQHKRKHTQTVAGSKGIKKHNIMVIKLSMVTKVK